jgi:D-glycero-D-manno-heptose 1,7-bisphosphate phosphatase
VRRAVFLDRDGVINENRGDYVKSWEEFVFLPGALAALRRLAQSPFVVVVISNQSAVGRGLLSVERLEDIHRRMVGDVARCGGRIDAIEYCPHRPDEACDCRKPRPGLLRRAAREHNLDLPQSYFIGDSRSDVEAGINAGCQPVLVLTGRGGAERENLPEDMVARCHVADDLGAALDWVLGDDRVG